MDNNIKDLLDGEIQKTLIEVSQCQTGSEEAAAAMNKLISLYQNRIKEEDLELKERMRIDEGYKTGVEHDLREKELDMKQAEITARQAQIEKELDVKKAELKSRQVQFAKEMAAKEKELELKEKELKGTKVDRIIRTILDILGIAVPLGVTSYWAGKSLKFEETGTYTSRTPQWISSLTRLFGGKRG